MMNENERNKIEQIVKNFEKYFSISSKKWKLSYRLFLILATLLSTSSAIVLKLNIISNADHRSDIAAVLSGLAAVTTTIVASLHFENYWRANQRAREQMRVISLEMEKSNPDADKIIDDIQKIIKEKSAALDKGE